MKRILWFLYYLILVTNLDAQDSKNRNNNLSDSLATIQNFKLGIGAGVMSLNNGIQLTVYKNCFGLDLLYGFSNTVSYSSKTRDIEIKNGLNIKFILCFAALVSKDSFDPFYIGFGYSHYFEEANIFYNKETGTITGYHFLLGWRTFNYRPLIDIDLGFNIELGYSTWNYDDSIPELLNEAEKYNLRHLYLGVGLSYYVL